jgi:glutamate-1-semialdehyde aminotransferase
MPNITQERYVKAKKMIPGGVQLLSKRPEMFAPDKWPAYFTKAKGCEVWDLDNKHYYDMTSCGIGSCLLGYADDDVSAAVIERVQNGSMCTLNPPEEVELAERLLAIHPWAECVRYTRTGGETAAVATRIARAATGRSLVAICGYHGWTDWYLAANLGESDNLDGHLLPGLDPLGVPRELRGTSFTFPENDTAAFDRVMEKYGKNLAAVVMEPMRSHRPGPGFLEHIRERTKANSTVLIFDEITIGWRYAFGGSHLTTNVRPDIAIFAKALGNGHPIGAVIGTKEVMESAQGSFISSTYWTESVGPTAALAVIKKIEKTKAWEHAAMIGNLVLGHWDRLTKKHNLPAKADLDGFPCLAHFGFTEQSLPLKTLYTVLMLDKGYLANTMIYPQVAHTQEIVEKYAQAMDEVFGNIAEIIKRGDVDKVIEGKVCHAGFKRLIS